MTVTEYVAAFGPVAGVFAFLWMNRSQSKGENPADPSVKLDAILNGQSDIKQMLALLLDRSKR